MTDPPPTLALTNVEVDGHRVDVVTRDGRIAAITAHGAGRAAGRADEHIDGAGGALLPGLHDHHVHLLATAAARWSLDVGHLGPGDGDVFATMLRRRADALSPHDEVRVVGYDEQIAGRLDRDTLDRLVGARPVRVQHRTGQLWVLSSASLDALGESVADAPPGLERDGHGVPTGRCWRIDAWLREQREANGVGHTLSDALAAVADELRARGVTGCTDATPFATLAEAAPLLDAAADRGLGVQLTFTGGPALADAPLPGGVERGPVKLLFDDHDPPPFDDLLAAVCTARAAGRAVAVHCVTRAGLALALALLDGAGAPRRTPAGDRIEHGAVIPPDALPELRRLGLTVVTQPAFPVERGERYLRDVDAADLSHLWPCARLLDAGIPVGAGSDAPYGPLDPWQAIAAATSRRAADGRRVGSDQPLDGRRALDLYLGSPAEPGHPRRVEVGAPADLVLFDAPLDTVLHDPLGMSPAAVIVAGHRPK